MKSIMETPILQTAVANLIGLLKGLIHGIIIPFMIILLVHHITKDVQAASISALAYMMTVASIYAYFSEHEGKWLAGQIYFYMTMPFSLFVIMAIAL